MMNPTAPTALLACTLTFSAAQVDAWWGGPPYGGPWGSWGSTVAADEGAVLALSLWCNGNESAEDANSGPFVKSFNLMTTIGADEFAKVIEDGPYDLVEGETRVLKVERVPESEQVIEFDFRNADSGPRCIVGMHKRTTGPDGSTRGESFSVMRP